MNIDDPSKLVALIAGPTASGKSAVAMQLAEATGGVVINADSAQVYADLRVLSARPSAADESRVPHRLFGFMDGASSCSAAHWANAAREAIKAAHAEKRLPILVGGTGLYIRTLLDGIAPVPDIPCEVRDAVRRLPVDQAHAALVREDPAAAARLSVKDGSRIARALEVIRASGRSLTEWQQARTGGIGQEVELAPLVLLPGRDLLYARCDARFDAMIQQGAIEEVAALLARRLDPQLPVMRAIGVRELGGWISGATTQDVARVSAKQATRRYAKRQVTWFSHQPPSTWQISHDTENYQWINDIVMILR